jgi:PAS domain S-box-containing protein
MRVAIVLALAVFLLVIGGASFARRINAVQPALGVEWVQAASGPLAVAVEPDSPAWKAGLREGDLLVEVDGRGVRSALDAATIGWAIADGSPVHLSVIRGPTRLDLALTPNWSPQSDIYIYLSIVGLAFWASGFLVTIRWPSVRGGMIYALLALCLATRLVLSQTGVGDRFDWTVHWTDLLAGALAPALLLHLAIVLSRRTLTLPGRWIAAGYAVAGFLTLFTIWLSPAGRGGAYAFESPVLAFETRDGLEELFLALALALSVVMLIKAHSRSASALHRGQLRWVLWGLGLGFGPSVVLHSIPLALGAPGLPSWASFLAVVPMLFVPAAFTAALARYRLNDLDVLLLRGLSEVSAIFCTFAVYAATVFLLREGVDELFSLSHGATRYVGFTVSAIAYVQIRPWIRRGVERAFYRKRYSYRATLLDWARELNAETDLGSLLARLRERICETLGVPRAEVLVQTGERRFDAIGAAEPMPPLELDRETMNRLERDTWIHIDQRSLPSMGWAHYLYSLKVKGSTRAVLAIAERRDLGEPLTSEDRALLGTLAAHAGTAIEAARLVNEVRQRATEVETLHARQAKILESSAVGLLLLDVDGRVQAWNRALEEIYGLAREAAIGHPLSDVFPLHVVRRIEREEGSQDEARIFRLSMVNRGGHRVVVNLAISPVDRAGDGGRVITFDDVTERVKLEEQVLRQERLASLGLLAAGVAHEINTPLTGISSYAQLLLEACDEKDLRRDLLEKIERQTQRAANITGSLLNLARPEETSIDTIDVNRTIQEILQLFEPQVRGSGIELRATVAEQLPSLRGHKGKLQQVLLNLLINARDAVDDGGTIELNARSVDGRIVVEVVDDGMGIAEEDLPRIFDPFFTTKGRGKGTGLGLSITYGIIHEHNGEIHVESTPNAFTRFRVELPITDSARAMA